MTHRNFITVLPASPRRGMTHTTGTQVITQGGAKIEGVRRIELVAAAGDVWRANLEVLCEAPPAPITAQLDREYTIVGDHRYPLVLFEDRTYTMDEVARYAAAHADACLSVHRAQISKQPMQLAERVAEICAALAIGAMLATMVFWVLAP